jgi:hypothetical protein
MHNRLPSIRKNSRAHHFTLFQNNNDVDGTTHHPNCSSVTDAQLASTIDGAWPSSNGKVEVNYVFSLPAFYWLFNTDSTVFKRRNLPYADEMAFESTVRLVIDKITILNNGIIKFNEVDRSFLTDYSPFFKGIYYAQTATEAQFSSDNEGAFTVLRFNNNGYIKQAIIDLPSDISIYNDLQEWTPYDWINYTISHETSHAFGGNHLQLYPDILAELENIPDGVFCSVMDYPNLISSNISTCMQNCTPSFAIYPGPLDIRSIQLVYSYDNYDHGYNKIYYYAVNAIEYALLFAIITTIYASVENILCKLAIHKNKPLIPKNVMQILLNAIILALFIEMGAPDVIPILFGASTSLKLMPKRLLKYSEFYVNHPIIENIFESRFPLHILVLTTLIAEGQLPAALALTLFFGITGTLLGTALGWIPDYLCTKRCNRQLEKLAYWFPDEEPEPIVEQVTGDDQGVELAVIVRQLPSGNLRLFDRERIPTTGMADQKLELIVEEEEISEASPMMEEKINSPSPHSFYQAARQSYLADPVSELRQFDWSAISFRFGNIASI